MTETKQSSHQISGIHGRISDAGLLGLVWALAGHWRGIGGLGHPAGAGADGD